MLVEIIDLLFLVFDFQMKRLFFSTEESGSFTGVRSESRENYRQTG